MADNITLNAGTTVGAITATDDIGGIHYQLIKLGYGALDSFTAVVTGTGLPVNIENVPTVSLSGSTTVVVASGTITAVTDITNPVTVTGGVAISLSTSVVISGALPAGTNHLGSISLTGSSSVAVSTVVPGTGATNLGKAVDVAVGASDVGVGMLAKHAAASTRLTTATGDYDIPRLSEFGALLTEPEQHLVIDNMDALTGFGGTWAAIDSDTTGVAVSTTHVLGSNSVSFDKVNGAANSGIGGVEKALTSVNLDGVSTHDIINCAVYVSSVADLDGGSAFFFLRLGTNSTDYAEWRIDGTEFTAGIWETVSLEIGDASHTGQGGTGIDWSAITYCAVGFSFDAVGDALSGILVDEISFHTNQHVNAAINAEITSSVSTANINLSKVAGSPATKGAGNVGAGTQRVTVATDDVNLAAIKTAVEGTLTVTGGGGGTEYTDDVSSLSAGALGAAIVAVATPTNATVIANQFGVPAMSLDRRLHVDADIVAATGGALSVTTDNISLSGGGTIAAVTAITNAVTVNGAVAISLSASVVISGPLPAGTNNIGSVSLTGSTSAVVQGTAAHDQPVSGSPLLMGWEARSGTPSDVGQGDAVRAIADLKGRVINTPIGARTMIDTNSSVSLTSSLTLTFVPGAASQLRDIVSFTLSGAASTQTSLTAAVVTITSSLTAGGGTAVLWRFRLAPNGGGVVYTPSTPIPSPQVASGWSIHSTLPGIAFNVQFVANI